LREIQNESKNGTGFPIKAGEKRYAQGAQNQPQRQIGKRLLGRYREAIKQISLKCASLRGMRDLL
jgi:hypothetical protein